MKITILSTAYPLRGGIAHFIGLLYKEFSIVHDVNVITFSRQYPSILFPGKTQLESGDSSEEIPSSVVVDSINPFNWIKVGRRIRNDAPDLLVFKYWMSFFAPVFGTITKLAKRNRKTKALVICDNVIPHEKKPWDKILTKYFFSAVDYFALMSESVQNDLLSIYPEANHKLLFHPVYSNFGKPVSKQKAKEFLKIDDEKVILFFGFIRDYKGLDDLLQAAALLKDKLKFKLLVAGEFYSNSSKYYSLIEELDLSENVKVLSDFIPTKEVKYYFSAADVVVLPYKSATQSGIVQIANNFSKPVIATDVGGLGEVINDGATGFLVEKENPEKLADAILNFYAEGKEKEFVSNIENNSMKYSWAEFVKGIFELVNSGD